MIRDIIQRSYFSRPDFVISAKMQTVKIENREIEPGQPCFIIAEIGMNHDGSFGQAKAFIEAAGQAGADAVKFQTHLAEEETLKDAPAPSYFTNEPRYEYFKRTAFNKTQLIKLKQHAESKGMIFLSSPFSVAAVDLLESINISAYKIPSGEVTNIPFLEHIAKTTKPIILSSGMSTLDEIEKALSILREHNNQIILMQCTSKYPCPYEEVGLNLIEEFREKYDLPIGLSDHTLTIYTSIAAVVLGACVVERHFTTSKKLYGPDAKYSLEPDEFKSLVEGIRVIEASLSHPVNKDDVAKFKRMRETFQKSIVSVVDIPKDTPIKPEMIAIKKPGTGLEPEYFRRIIGKVTIRDIAKDSLIEKKDIQW